MKKIYNLLFILIIGLAVAIVVTAFNNPPGNPPTGGGTIGVGTNAPANSIYVKSDGSVGIGTASPGARLDIEGGNLDLSGNNITGVNKISVNTIDPIFKINGQKYVTYVPDSLGQKVEVAGAAQLVNGEWSIDLAEQTSNPDLWLFYQIIKPESIIPFVSSQSPASLYAFFDGSKLVVKLKDGDSQARFSYRLMADRIDSQGSNYLLPETEANEVYIDVDLWKK